MRMKLLPAALIAARTRSDRRRKLMSGLLRKRGRSVLLTALLMLPATSVAARNQSPTCTFTSTGGTLNTALSLKHSPLGRNVTLAVSESGSPAGQRTMTTKLSRGHQSLLVLTATIASSGALDATTQLGAGFHGVRTLTL